MRQGALALILSLLIGGCGPDLAPSASGPGEDGVLDRNNGTPVPEGPDSDQDGLPDAVEDKNGNGVLDEGTTETDANNPDTDGDGLLDGDEDRDGDGVLDPGETDPHQGDTDGDGLPDAQENTALACARSNRGPTSRLLPQSADWLLTLDGEFVLSAEVDLGTGARRPQGAAVDAPSQGIFGFILVREPARSVLDAQSQLIIDANAIAAVGRPAGLRTRNALTWDGFDAAAFSVEIQLDAPAQASTLRDGLMAALAGVDPGSVSGLPPAAGPSGERFTLLASTVYRTERRIVTFGALIPSEVLELEGGAYFKARDFGDGTALAQRSDAHTPGCDPFEPSIEGTDVDLLWVVDRSLSMRDDQEAVAAAADGFFETINNTDLDFRMAVTSSDNRQNLWVIEETGFTNDPDAFRAAMLDPPGRDFEFGLTTGLNIARQAAGNVLDAHQTFRRAATRIVVFFSDEEDIDIENAAQTPGCDPAANPALADCAPLQEIIAAYQALDITAFAITGDAPTGCQSQNGPGKADEAGIGYTQTALATGGSFGSICADDLSATFEEIIQASYGVASAYALSRPAISSTVKVVINGQAVPRSRAQGFDYDPINHSILFFGAAAPDLGDELAVSYLTYEDLSPDPDPQGPIVD